MEAKGFDEQAREGLRALLGQFWIVRDKEPDLYRLIRERKTLLQKFFLDRMGLRLLIHRHFIKLEKLPLEPESWMGFSSFRQPLDYTLFSCVLAFLEGKNIEEQFLLSELCQDLKTLIPAQLELDWNHYEHRKSLVRALQGAVELNLLQGVEGDITEFRHDEEQEVLYEVPLISRYFMPVIQEEGQSDSSQPQLSRRQRIYRDLFLKPAVHRQGREEDFEYLRRYHQQMVDDISAHTDFQLEVYRDVAFLVTFDKRTAYDTFPDNRGVADVALHFITILRRERQKGTLTIEDGGKVLLTQGEFRGLVAQTQEEFSAGWSKEYRTGGTNMIAHKLYQFLLEWEMVGPGPQERTLFVYPHLARLQGEYPPSFEPFSVDKEDM